MIHMTEREEDEEEEKEEGRMALYAAYLLIPLLSRSPFSFPIFPFSFPM